MSNANGIIWLASYPKSGNTWFRILLSHILNTSDALHYINDINSILGSHMLAERRWMNAVSGFDTTLLSHEEVDQLRPAAYTWYARTLRKKTCIKIHDAYTFLKDGRALIPDQGSYAALYFIRNPLDVAISLAHYAKCPLDWSIQMMGSPYFVIPQERLRNVQLRQKLLTWSQHVQSWASAKPIRRLVLRYEDMLANPSETFGKGLEFLDLKVSDSRLQAAIEATSFDKLQQQEAKFGFREKLSTEGQFFRKGIAGDWKNVLEPRQIEKIIQDHGEVMRQFGYLDDENQPL